MIKEEKSNIVNTFFIKTHCDKGIKKASPNKWWGLYIFKLNEYAYLANITFWVDTLPEYSALIKYTPLDKSDASHAKL